MISMQHRMHDHNPL